MLDRVRASFRALVINSQFVGASDEGTTTHDNPFSGDVAIIAAAPFRSRTRTGLIPARHRFNDMLVAAWP